MNASRTARVPIQCAVFACLAILAACGGDEEHAIEDVRRGRRVGPGERTVLTHGERFGRPAPGAFTYDLPDGWKAEKLGPGAMRKVSLKTAGDEPAEVAVFLLPASPLLDNVNRWRRQMGTSPATIEDLPALAYDWHGTAATLVDLTGTHEGMGGRSAENQRFLGLLVPFRGQMLSVKLVGTVAEVIASEQAFDDFLQSLRFTRGASTPSGGNGMGTGGNAGHSGGQRPPSTGSDLSQKLRWTVPTGWAGESVRGKIRIATFRIEMATEVEVRLSVLSGAGGGLVETARMWAGDIGASAPAVEDIAAFRRIPILGTEAVLVELTGKPTAASAGEDKVERGLLGLYCPLETHSIFLLAVGRASDVALQRAAFLELCTSLRMEE